MKYLLIEHLAQDEGSEFGFLKTFEYIEPFINHVCMISKQNFIPPLIIRPAREEDHDDLTFICDIQSELQTSDHGNFFIAEMIASQQKDKLCLVAEDKNHNVIGMMLISLKIDLLILHQHFELDIYGMFCKEDFSESVNAYIRQQEEEKIYIKEVDKYYEEEKQKVLRQMSSYQQNIRLLQEFAVEKLKDNLEDFEKYKKEEEKQKKLSNIILKKLIDKYFKYFDFSQPHSFFEKVEDPEVFHFIISPTDFLLRVLYDFDLPEQYLKGDGHWKPWIEREIQRLIEEQRNKGLAGKRKMKTKQKHKDKHKNEISLPDGFDIEPFLIALKGFLKSNLEVRNQIASLFLNNENNLIDLYSEKNGELDHFREIEFGEIIELIERKNGIISPSIRSLILPILISFGSLNFHSKKIILPEKKQISIIVKKQAVNLQTNSSSLSNQGSFTPFFTLNEKKLYYIKLNDLMDAVNQILEEDLFYVERYQILETQKNQFDQKKEDGLNEIRKYYSELNLKYFNDVKQNGIKNTIQEIPSHLLNAACINIFFISDEYSKRATDFLPYVFNYIPDKEYLILTQPRMANETFLISNFEKVTQKQTSNFNHSLFFFHKSNLFTHFLNIQPIFSDEYNYLQKKLFPEITSSEDLHTKYFNQIRNIVKEKKKLKEIFKIKTQSLIFDNKFVKEEQKEEKKEIKKIKNKTKKRNFYKKFEDALNKRESKKTFMLKETQSNVVPLEECDKSECSEVDRLYFKLVFECEELRIKKDLGIARISSQIDSSELLSKYDLSSLSFHSIYSKKDFLEIENIQLNLLFSSYSSFFVREILRITNKKVLLLSSQNISNCQQIFPYLTPLPKLFECKFIKTSPGSFADSYSVLSNTLTHELSNKLSQQPSSLDNLLSSETTMPVPSSSSQSHQAKSYSKLGLDLFSLSNKKHRINLKIVLVGNSSTSIGILHELLNLNDIRFENICLLSSEFISDSKFFGSRQKEKNTQDSFLERLYLEHNVTLIRGEMIVLDRKTKTILAKSLKRENFEISYDYLIITTGLKDKTKQLLADNGVFKNIFNLDLDKDLSSHQNTNTHSSIHLAASEKNQNNNMDSHSKNDSSTLQKHIKEKSSDSSSVVNQNTSDEQNQKENFIDINTNFIVSINSIKKDILKCQQSLDGHNDQKEILKRLTKEKNWAGKLLHHKIPQNVSLYGESPNIFATLNSLIKDFKIETSKICIIIPNSNSDLYLSKGKKTENSNLKHFQSESNEKVLEIFDKKIEIPILFENIEIKEFYFSILEYFGIHVLRGYDIFGLSTEPNSLVLKKGENELKASSDKREIFQLDEKSSDKLNKKFIEYAKLLKNFKFGMNTKKLSQNLLNLILDKKGENIFQYKDLDILKIIESNSMNKHIVSKSTKILNSLKYSEQKYGLYRNINEEGDHLLKNTILLTGNKIDVGSQVFTAVQENGLVFNGRLIVTSNFRTIDQYIYACGKISEFSQRYKNEALGRSLRMDKFDGFEVGTNFANQFISLLRGEPYKESFYKQKKEELLNFRHLLPSFENNSRDSNALKDIPQNISKDSISMSKSNIYKSMQYSKEYQTLSSTLENKRKTQIPSLHKPLTQKIKLFPGYFYLQIKKPFQGKIDFERMRSFESTNTLYRDIKTLMKNSSDAVIYQLAQLDNNGLPKEKISAPKIYTFNPKTNKISLSSLKSEQIKKDLSQNISNLTDIDQNEEDLANLLTDKEPEFGHYLLFEFDQNNLVTKIEYLGKDEPVIEAFSNLFGLHKTFFNKMFERKESGLVNDFVEFIQKEWGMLLCNPFFDQIKFCLNNIFDEILSGNSLDCNQLLAEVLEELHTQSNNASTNIDLVYERLLQKIPVQISTQIKVKVKEYLSQFLDQYKV